MAAIGQKRTSRVNIVLENSYQVKWYTDMSATLSAMGVDPHHYDWYLSDIETNVAVPLLENGDAWFTGAELAALLKNSVQFSWAVFSAVSPGTRVEMSSPPVADGNSSFWVSPEARPQLESACFEVVCWDSSATILVGVSPEQADAFLQVYTDAKPLYSTWPKDG